VVMPRGRHRHSPPLHRILPPAAVAAAALVFAGASWLIGDMDGDALLLRGCAAAAAAAAVTGAVLLRSWDRAAGRRVGEFKARLAGAEWRAEERQAELEGERDEAREARDGMARKVREKRAELARLRTEHAALLRRYAHAESERAGALEGRRQLELEAGEPTETKELTASGADHRAGTGAPTALTYLQAYEALNRLTRSRAKQLAQRERAEAKERLVPAPNARATATAVVPPSAASGAGAPRAGAAHTGAPRTGVPGQGGPASGERGERFDFFASKLPGPGSETASDSAASAPDSTESGADPQPSVPARRKPADGQDNDGQDNDGQSADGQPADGQPADGRSADGQSADERATAELRSAR